MKVRAERVDRQPRSVGSPECCDGRHAATYDDHICFANPGAVSDSNDQHNTVAYEHADIKLGRAPGDVVALEKLDSEDHGHDGRDQTTVLVNARTTSENATYNSAVPNTTSMPIFLLFESCKCKIGGTGRMSM